MACDWTVSSRTGALTVVAVILDRDLHGTLEMSKDEAIQIPASIESLGAATPVNATSLLVPKPTVFAGTATYRFTGVTAVDGLARHDGEPSSWK